MTSERRSRTWGIGVLAVGVAAVVAVSAWQPWTPRAAVDTAAAGTSGWATEPLSLPAGADVLVFGDSWTYGSAATTPTDGYAYQLGDLQGWDVTVDGVRGSGYMKPGRDGADFGTRALSLDPGADYDLVVIQGSINDRLQGDRGYRENVDITWSRFEKAFPDAQFVIFGPAPHEFPVDEGTARIDRDLAAEAAERGWWYISPLAENWITPANYADIIDAGAGRKHPSDAGHSYLAERLAGALTERSVTTVAGDEKPLEPVG
ncbi:MULTISPECIES: SGNH/GDSL hydrolase family protein [unclassified Microbacterium]|uniref:SGNH/GDSL hydrolase family protein n=1 Tax=unclassified Microbacterium TaxID=2609290 RepID=UPI00386F2994